VTGARSVPVSARGWPAVPVSDSAKPVASNDLLVLAIDQGTSATKCIVVGEDGSIRRRASVAIDQQHPQPGWAEQDPMEIWRSVQQATREVLEGLDPAQVAAVGLSTQRESTVLWDRATGAPLGPLLGWQDIRGAEKCARLRLAGYAERVFSITGLPLDPMFSAAKASALLDLHDPDRSRSSRGELCLGTVDSWLLCRLSGQHLIEAGNAARTQLLDITSRRWDPWLLDLFAVPVEALPTVVASTGPFVGCADLDPLPPAARVTGVLGDSHAALFAHAGWRPGQVKVTYGTGSSVMGVTADPLARSAGVARTVAWELDRPTYALEGNIRATGATLVWLARLLGMTPAEVAAAAGPDSGGVVLVPAFTGLGAPWWDDKARGTITGLSADTGRAQLCRAGLESITFQVEDVVSAVEKAAGLVTVILADGGPSANSTLMQLQADTSGRQVSTSQVAELSALGAAHVAGVGAGVWSMSDLDALPRPRSTYRPGTASGERDKRLQDWHTSVAAARGIATQSGGTP
jgi:glycerol kinase